MCVIHGMCVYYVWCEACVYMIYFMYICDICCRLSLGYIVVYGVGCVCSMWYEVYVVCSMVYVWHKMCICMCV